MKKTILACFFATLSAALSAATVESVLVRQMWPWSTDILVEYRLSGVDATHPAKLSVRAFNGETEIGAGTLAQAICGNVQYVTEGTGSFKILTGLAFGSGTVSFGNFRVQLTAETPTVDPDEVLYKIVDLTSPYTVKDLTRREILSGEYGSFATSYAQIDPEFSTSLSDVLIWTGVTENDVYKTDKMVFRKIPAGGKSYKMQAGNSTQNSGEGVEVSFSKDFYIAVFEITQAQYANFFSVNPWETYPTAPCLRAYAGVRPRFIRPPKWSASDAGGIHAISSESSSLCGRMQNRIGLLFDMPTEAMWEYACRAGTTGALYTGDSTHTATKTDSHVLKIMRANLPWTDDKTLDLDRNAGIPGQHLPNAWGLYDMLGNLCEPCLDGFSNLNSYTLLGGTDPLSGYYEQALEAQTATDYNVTVRGGYYFAPKGGGDNTPSITPANSTSRISASTSSDARSLGARICIYLDHNNDGTKNP